ncbi:MAG: hypothetical protein GX457_16395 [Thermotogaceae bacterium]|nr:hypothetical protein [Thermotogaceae bacterium]
MREVLSLFFCTKNRDVETFLRDKAITFEKASRARTYLILDEEALTDGKIAIIAYFTVSMKALNLREGISKNVRKHLDGLGNKQGSTFVVYLIGQLGKNDNYRSEIDGKELIAMAIATIKEAYDVVGGRYILVECEPVPGLKKLYEDNDFTFLQESLENDSLIQFIRFIDP